MNSKEWIKEFESLNDRKPTPAEFSEAKKNGLFTTENEYQSNTNQDRLSNIKNGTENSDSNFQNKVEFFLFRMNQKTLKDSNDSHSLEEFQLQKHGMWLNIFLILINSFLFFILWIIILDSSRAVSNGEVGAPALFGLVFISVFLSLINLVPTLISHTNWKYLIFIFNIFIGPTIIGWLVLLLLAISTNKSDRREQEMAYLIRKMSNKLGED
ncbi:hypothetical protein [Streptococcus symci]|uniref:Uncharacterized protein n=1 Tax=Streptococcus symci TaxID=2588991 RepID=A0A501PDT8_9STRE|nr:hypothetical protein [Streptococcus symci]TPD58593.1 hypothetical protein FJN11_03345 [Streptococcus symci]